MTTYELSFDDIPIPDELPTFVDNIDFEDDSTGSEMPELSSPLNNWGSCSSNFDFEFTNPSRKTRITT
jgi:hypothetical protein